MKAPADDVAKEFVKKRNGFAISDSSANQEVTRMHFLLQKLFTWTDNV